MKDKVQGARWAPVFLLCRALSEAESKTKAELSASQFGTLKECKPKAKQEFSERNKQSFSEAESKTKAELSASQFGTLNECKPEKIQ